MGVINHSFMKRSCLLLIALLSCIVATAQYKVGTSTTAKADYWGNTKTTHKDSYGNTTGTSTTAEADYWGNTKTTHKDNYGNVVGTSTTAKHRSPKRHLPTTAKLRPPRLLPPK